jgi:hypothetical protein
MLADDDDEAEPAAAAAGAAPGVYAVPFRREELPLVASDGAATASGATKFSSTSPDCSIASIAEKSKSPSDAGAAAFGLAAGAAATLRAAGLAPPAAAAAFVGVAGAAAAAALAAGTTISPPHALHFARLPAKRSSTR